GKGEALAEDLRHSNIEPFRVADFAGAIFTGVETESLFVNVTEQMKRLYSNVGSTKAALQQRPEVFNGVGVNVAMHVVLKVIHDKVSEPVGEPVIVGELISVNPSSRHDVTFDY